MTVVGTHVVLFSSDAEGDRAFLRDVLGFPHVDAGGGWLVFKLPPAEVAVHPADADRPPQLYLMCTDLDAAVRDLAASGVACGAVTDARWGRSTWFRLPGGGEVGLYEPRHPVATDL